MSTLPDQPKKRKSPRRRKGIPQRGSNTRRPTTMVASIPDRYQDFINGELTVADLDDEEIMRGQIRNSVGDFRGRPPLFIPREFMVQVMAERDQRIRSELMPLVQDAMRTLKAAMTSGTTVHDGPKINAAIKALEYTIGKPTEKVQVTGDIKVTQYSNVIDGATVEIGELAEVEEEMGDI